MCPGFDTGVHLLTLVECAALEPVVEILQSDWPGDEFADDGARFSWPQECLAASEAQPDVFLIMGWTELA